jgi:hypothetical protein
MPCTDPREVTRLAQAFDLTTTEIVQWELELIWRAEELELLALSTHAAEAADDESIPRAAIRRIVRNGIPRSKDATTRDGRQIGINFEGKLRRTGWIRTKVTWRNEYIVATVHTL